jgi:DNA-binding MarR family transcriptional regulator
MDVPGSCDRESRVKAVNERTKTGRRGFWEFAPGAAKGVDLIIPDENQLPASESGENFPSETEFRALAAFRSTLRKFLAFSEQAAANVGLTTQRYQALLVIKTYPGGDHISVGQLAGELMVKEHSAAEMVSRLVQAKLVRRKTDPTDRRRSLVVLTASGERCLSHLASVHLRELRKSESAFLDLFNAARDEPLTS